MTRTTNARLAGLAFLVYIATAFPAMIILDRAKSGPDIAAKLANVAGHASDVRLTLVLMIIGCVIALVMAVTLYAITRDEDPDIALLALCCRVAEGVVSANAVLATLGLLALSKTAAVAGGGPDAAGAHALGGFLLKLSGWSTTLSAIFFLVGSTLFSYLLMRGHIVPAPLAWLGVVASILLLVVVPGEFTGFMRPAGLLMWMPMLMFEVVLGLWLLIKGAAAPTGRGVDHRAGEIGR